MNGVKKYVCVDVYTDKGKAWTLATTLEDFGYDFGFDFMNKKFFILEKDLEAVESFMNVAGIRHDIKVNFM